MGSRVEALATAAFWHCRDRTPNRIEEVRSWN
jgi:hypothetical protein